MSISQAPERVVPPLSATVNAKKARADEFDAFFRNHPKVAPYLLCILEVYKKCDRVQQLRQPLTVEGILAALAQPSFEEAYLHVFGSPTRAACERCKPAFYREKQLLTAPIAR